MGKAWECEIITATKNLQELSIASLENESMHLLTLEDEIKNKEQEVVAELLVRCKPILRYISSDIEIGNQPAKCYYDENVSDFHDKKGISICGKLERISSELNATDGSYDGEEFFLCHDLSVLGLGYRGSWSNWQGSSSYWEAEVTEHSNFIEAGLKIAAILRSLLNAFNKAIKQNENKKVTLESRLKRIESMKRILTE